MKNTKHSLFLLLSVALIASYWGCQPAAPKWVEHDGFQLAIPEELEPTDRLSEDFSCQYQNYYRELYLLGQAQPWDQLEQQNPNVSLRLMYDFHLDNLALGLQEPQLPEPDSMLIDSLPALVGQIDGMYKGDKIHYKLVLIQGDDQLYQLLLWTISAHRSDNETDMQAIIQSFKES